MFNSKLIELPTFSSIPGTDAANVYENIDLWIDDNKEDRIKNFLRPDDNGYRGYRFVNSDDFKEEKYIVKVILGVVVTVYFTRLVHRTDSSFCPLWFTLWRYDVEVKIENEEPFEFKSDNDLKKRIREYKKNKINQS